MLMGTVRRGSASTAALLVVAVAGLAVSAVSAAPQTGVGPKSAADEAALMRLDAGRAGKWFHVVNPAATSSPAWRDNSDMASKEGVVPEPSEGYTVTSRVLVRAADMETVAQVYSAARPADPAGFDAQPAIVPVEGAPGFFIIEIPTIADAGVLVEQLKRDARVIEAELDIEQPKVLRALPTDPSFGSQWHLRNTTNTIADSNVEAAWNAGYTGTGVTIGILEGGWQTNHPDLSANYNSTASQSGGSNTAHGTSCAGVAGAVANNGRGGVGSAYGARLSKLLYGASSTTAAAFGFRNDLNFVKSNSWGPPDNGRISYLSSTERSALQTAFTSGRGNKGTIVTFANGNGGTADRSDYDPYASCRFVLPIGAIGDNDTRASYQETGSNQLVCTHSSGNVRSVYTTDVTGGQGYSSGDYTSTFGGTSAACPHASGVIALLLQRNPNLTVRDVEHILIRSARRNDSGNSQWVTNGAGRWVNYNYGYGAIDAGAAVTLAGSWSLVPAQASLTTNSVSVNAAIPDNNTAGVTRSVTVSQGFKVEKVELVMNVTHTYIGDLQIVITSPSGTQSIVSAVRGDPTDNLAGYIFLSRRHWDELAAGTWSINVSDRAATDAGTWTNYTLNLYGTNVAASEAAPVDPTGSEGIDLEGLGRMIGAFGSCDRDADRDGDGLVSLADIRLALAGMNGSRK